MAQLKKDVLVHKVYTELKKIILNGELKPGEKLYQEKIAKQFGVSRTPLIKALHILEQEMVLESIPGRGMYVKSRSIIDLLNAFECRQGIETTAVRTLTGKITEKEFQSLYSVFKPFLNSNKIDPELYLKADQEFHSKIVNLTKNNYLIRMNKIAHVFNDTYKEGLIRNPEETLSEHLMILSAIETKDCSLAEEYMRNHLRKSIERIKIRIAEMH
jgi:DNA-binding GntR family transcriptional regulator